MQKHQSSERAQSVLHPSTPFDIGARSQRLRIVEAMVASCAEKTYAATTISDIVAGARISRTTFYKRFADKRECFDASVDYCVTALQEVAADAHSAEDPPAVAARKGATAVLEAMAARPAMAQILTGDAISVEPSVVERYRRLVIEPLQALWTRAREPAQGQTDPRLAFGQAQVLIFNEIAAGHSERLPDLLVEIVYLAVAPFAGHDEALRQSELAKRMGVR